MKFLIFKALQLVRLCISTKLEYTALNSTKYGKFFLYYGKHIRHPRKSLKQKYFFMEISNDCTLSLYALLPHPLTSISLSSPPLNPAMLRQFNQISTH